MPDEPKAPPITVPEAIRSVHILHEATAKAALPLLQHQQLQALRDRVIAFISEPAKPTAP